ncbi:ATP phosphoribosyltransferase regulatory subunit [Acetitomaculum ruminis DSM 5522]|uniref:ATP phosphoribosyltransferase regulatory subunit n=1 Tax=Acetitomaculum ruminis DSM 5522 TaxID=1120918 RepID=A0A1I0VBP2_9FIRM|nr:ATP phosphoribosyltransferase regulatory subunit [Acetitomaculum ruminis]SFA73006.1 ATP phosphoribosyltransferase regulatory subunit [Acetitomaculum ruminis DSM 5522]
MKDILLHTPEGVRDIYNYECEEKEIVKEKLHNTIHKYGYHSIETPTIEFFDIFSKDIGTTPSKELYRFFDKDGNTLVLRPDFTPSIARCAAKYYQDESIPVKLCYTGQTFVNHASYQGRLKETTQMGAELIGDTSIDADVEILALLIECLKNAGLNDFQISIGEVDFFNSLIEESNIDSFVEEELRELITKKNFFGVEELVDSLDMNEDHKNLFLNLLQLYGNIEVLEAAKKLTSNEKALKAIDRIEEIFNILKCFGYEKYISFDLGLITKIKYYTGITFKAFTYGSGDDIASGGRYDTLIEKFGKEAPSIGFALNLDKILIAMQRQKIDVPLNTDSKLVIYEKENRECAIDFCQNLREKNIKVNMLITDKFDGFEKYFEYAKSNVISDIIYLKNNENIQIYNLTRKKSVNLVLEIYKNEYL